MWSNYVLSLYRTLSRHRLYAALNVLGLALGIAVFIILMLVVRFETSFDKWIPDAAHIYRINQIRMEPGRPPHDGGSTQPILLPALQTDFPQIQAAARLWQLNVVVRQRARQDYESIVLADPSIFDVFRLPLVGGDRTRAISDDSGAVITRAEARKYFGTDDPMGRTLTVVLAGVPRDYRVTGVLKDLPPNTHLDLGVIVRFDPSLFPKDPTFFTRWGSSMLYSYVRLRSADDAHAIQAAMPAFVDRHVTGHVVGRTSQYMDFRLIPISDLHFHDAKDNDGFKGGVDPLFVSALGVMGLVTLMIAVVNYISLTTARSGMRAREVAVRKVMGATRRALVVQFIAESVAVALAAGLIAAALAELAMPAVDAVLGEPIRITYSGLDGVTLPLVGICLLVGLTAGAYPAVVLSHFRPAAVLASARTPGGGRMGARIREALAIFQFGVAITLMISTAVIFTQMRYLRTADIGFRRDGLIIVQNLGDEFAGPRSTAILDAFRRVPGVVSATASDRRPATGNNVSGTVKRLDDPAIKPDLMMERIAPDYVRTYGVQLVAGRPLGVAQRFDDSANIKDVLAAGSTINVMINEGAARALGFASPARALGRRLAVGETDGGQSVVATVVGVMRDVRFVSPRTAPPPQIYMEDSRIGESPDKTDWSAAVRIREADRAEVTRGLAQVWKTLVPSEPFFAQSVAAAMQPYYDPDARRGQLFAAGAVLSGLIACLGLYGLAAFNTARRFKEIGIRKTLGASTRDVMRLLIGEFLRPVLWANVIAWPTAWFAMRAWLAGFDQRIALNPAYFLAPAIAAVLVAILTVADQAWRVARAEPAVALRYE